MIRGFWLVPVGILTTLAVIIMYAMATSSGSMPGGNEHFLLLFIAEAPLLAFFILNLNHRKHTDASQDTALLRREIELLEKGMKDKDAVIEALRGK